MIPNDPGPLTATIGVAWTLLSAGLVLAFYRLVRGPSLPDRVVALDLTATLVVGMIAVDAIASRQPVILDAAIVVSLVAFVGTVAFAHFVEKRGSE